MRLIITIKQSILVWLTTSILASVFHWLNETTGLGIEKIILLSLAFSLPAMILLIPNYYFLIILSNTRKRMTYGFVSVLLLCVIVVILFLRFIKGFPIDQQTIILLVTPYILAAEFSFFLFSRKLFTICEHNK